MDDEFARNDVLRIAWYSLFWQRRGKQNVEHTDIKIFLVCHFILVFRNDTAECWQTDEKLRKF